MNHHDISPAGLWHATSPCISMTKEELATDKGW